MGKKVKIGKQRRDKFYHLAKEAGYRSRAAFKLIQLNKRFEFLQSSRALVDLCAAPGGWMQVAKQNMPVSSICVGVDLVPIKPVHGCISLQGDITEESTRQAIKKELKGFQCDTVLHDGAPNVGMNWIHDAFQQNCLTLMALKMATQILKRNGTFVTKVFRSNDYHHLITVFEKLFKKVHVWKPAASRLESAEIFVVCEKYSKPEKVDPDLLNVKKVFLEPNLDPAKPNSQVLLFNKKQKKVKAEGYAEDETITMYKTSTATEFIDSHNYLDLLAKSNSVILDQEKWSASPDTTEEILEYLKDIKTCGPRELRIILKWRKKMKALQESETPTNEMEVEKASEEKTEENPEDKEDRELAEIEAQIAQASATERAALKKKKKKMLLEKAKVLKRKQLKMIHEGDEGPIEEMHDLFSLKSIKKAKMSLLSGDREVPDFKDDEDEDEFGLGQGEWETHGSDEKNDGGTNAAEESDEENELIHTEERLMEPTERRAQNVSSWFNKSAITDLLSSDDEDDELDAVERYMRKTKHTFKDNTVSFEEPAKRKKIDDDLEAPNISDFNREMDVESEEEYEDADKRVEKRKPKEESKEAKTSVSKVTELTPEQLALAEQLIYSSKTRSELEDWGWNRYTNNDEGLPAWFVDDEKKHYRKELPVTREQVKFYRDRLKEINVRPIKKVAEAKARKARRTSRRMEKAKKKAEAIVENENLEHPEKVREMKKLYRNANKKEDRKVHLVVVNKGNRGKMNRPSGRYKTVDRRMKSELRAQKAADKRSGGKRGRGGRAGSGRGKR